MSSPDQAAQPSPRQQARALARELTQRGFIATVVRQRNQRHPCVHIAARRGWHQAEYIYAAPDQGRWWFWWSSLDPIAPISDLTATADTITGMLTPALAACRRAGTALPQPVMVPVLAVPAGDPGHAHRPGTGRISHAS
jgi:hypothetical protein